MIINWILPEVTKSGGVRVALEYANMLSDLGHDVICYAPQSGQHYGIKRIIFLKEVLKMKMNKDYQGAWFQNRFRFVFPMWINNKSVRDADVTIATSWITAYWVFHLTPEKGKKVYFIQGFETWGNEKYNRIVLNSYKLKFDKRITVSTALQNRLKVEVGSDSEVICNGLEDCFLKETKKDFSRIIIGMPFRDSENKNCQVGLLVLKALKEKYPNIDFVSYGFKKPENWNDHIKFIENPTRSDLVKFYNSINIFYVPSIYEGWGLPAMEAMGQENVVVAARSGLIEEIGLDNVNCIVLNDPKNQQEAIDKISKTIENKQKMVLIGQNARKSVSLLSISSSSKKLNDLLKNLILRDEFI